MINGFLRRVSAGALTWHEQRNRLIPSCLQVLQVFIVFDGSNLLPCSVPPGLTGAGVRLLFPNQLHCKESAMPRQPKNVLIKGIFFPIYLIKAHAWRVTADEVNLLLQAMFDAVPNDDAVILEWVGVLPR